MSSNGRSVNPTVLNAVGSVRGSTRESWWVYFIGVGVLSSGVVVMVLDMRGAVNCCVSII